MDSRGRLLEHNELVGLIVCVGPHRYSGPTVGIGGRSRPIAGDPNGLSPSTFYTRLFHLIFFVWD